MSKRSCLLAMLILVGVACAHAEAPPRVVSRGEYGQQVQTMLGIIELCRGQASACDEKIVPKDEVVAAEAGEPEFQVRWGWLHATLRKASGVKDPVDKDAEEALVAEPPVGRLELLDQASTRLHDDLAELMGSTALDDGGAKGKVTEVLSRREFGMVQEASLWQRAFARIAGRVEEWWERMTGVVPWAPWMGVAFEWGLLAAAAVVLIVWAMRLSMQQRVSFATERAPTQAWQAESDDWAARAKAEAAKGEWREAVHCLYWSAIVMLEGQRLWRQNRARTPREYVGLLEPGSARRKVLGGLTSVFERIWYGIRPATGEDYDKAAKLLEELRVG